MHTCVAECAGNGVCLCHWGPPLFEDVPLVEFMYLVFTRMPGKSYPRLLMSLLLCLCDVYRVLIDSLVSRHCFGTYLKFFRSMCVCVCVCKPQKKETKDFLFCLLPFIVLDPFKHTIIKKRRKKYRLEVDTIPYLNTNIHWLRHQKVKAPKFKVSIFHGKNNVETTRERNPVKLALPYTVLALTLVWNIEDWKI